MAKMRKKKYVSTTTFDLARQRMKDTYDRFDRVVVSFSGGKDSTACLQLALEVAETTNRLPLEVYTFDEEAIPHETVEYMERVRLDKRIKFNWYCVPIEHRNACSGREPLWYPWAEEARDRWTREMPDNVLTEIQGFKRGMAIPDCTPLLYGPQGGTTANVMGIRCDESITRLRAIVSSSKRNPHVIPYDGSPWLSKVYPIYDWPVTDVWLAPLLYGWDYNRAYDVMSRAGLGLHEQRCAPPYGEQPIRRLWTYKVCWPELWDKMINRVHGAATAARYANTGLYGIMSNDVDLSSGETWMDKTLSAIQSLPDDQRHEVSLSLSSLLNSHKVRTSDPMPDSLPHPKSGFSWKLLYIMAVIGGDKLGRQTQKIAGKAMENRRKRGITE